MLFNGLIFLEFVLGVDDVMVNLELKIVNFLFFVIALL